MLILSHRGYWLEESEKNQAQAFIRSFDLGFGTELDLRDYGSKIVVCHDMPKGSELSFENLLDIMAGRDLMLALNIKADGLADEIMRILDIYSHKNYFTFDMSLPDLVVHLRKGCRAFVGISDYNPQHLLQERSSGVWLDAFESDWFDAAFIDQLLERTPLLCVVSSELHKRDNLVQWHKIKSSRNIDNDNLMLCTDKPECAKEFFNV